jgi:hypothetical protein
MGWLIVFIISWILFVLTVDWKRLKINVWCGLLAVVMQLTVDCIGIKYGLYVILNPIISIFNSSAFFTLGPVFTVGTLLAQYHPLKRKWAVIAYVLAITALYSIQELLLLNLGDLKYLKWSIFDSLVVNIGAMLCLSWFSIVILKKRGDN